jgi:hypothetical protein
MRPPPSSTVPTPPLREATEAAAIVAALAQVIAGGRGAMLTTPRPATSPAPSPVVPPCPPTAVGSHRGDVSPPAWQGEASASASAHIVSGTSVRSPAPVASPNGCSCGFCVQTLQCRKFAPHLRSACCRRQHRLQWRPHGRKEQSKGWRRRRRVATAG